MRKFEGETTVNTTLAPAKCYQHKINTLKQKSQDLTIVCDNLYISLISAHWKFGSQWILWEKLYSRYMVHHVMKIIAGKRHIVIPIYVLIAGLKRQLWSYRLFAECNWFLRKYISRHISSSFSELEFHWPRLWTFQAS